MGFLSVTSGVGFRVGAGVRVGTGGRLHDERHDDLLNCSSPRAIHEAMTLG